MLPEAFADVWGFYQDLDRKRSRTDMGEIQPISWRDIRDWRDLWGVNLSHDELDLIDALDETFREVWSKHAKAERDRTRNSQGAPRRSGRR